MLRLFIRLSLRNSKSIECEKFAQVYAEMDEASAAAILTQMGVRLDMIAETLQAMNRKNASKIIESMSPDFAARVTERLNELYRGE